MSRIFSSYRRARAQSWTGRLGENLIQAFGNLARLFGVASIPQGGDFIVGIERAVRGADEVLVRIGPRRLDLRDVHNARRFDERERCGR